MNQTEFEKAKAEWEAKIGSNAYQIGMRISDTLTELRDLNRERDTDMLDLLTERDRLETELAQLSDNVKAKQAAAPQTPRIKELEAVLENLKDEFADAYDPALPKTFAKSNGSGAQYRVSSKTVIKSHTDLARALLDQNLWDELGAEVKVPLTKIRDMGERGALPGVGIERQVTVALLQPRTGGTEW